MDASEWEYVGEGGENAIFSFRNSIDDEHHLFGNPSLLRIRKRDLAASSLWEESDPYNKSDKSSSHVDERKYSTYVLTVIAPNMKTYVDVPEIFPLEVRFLKELYNAAILSNRIPSARIADWNARKKIGRKDPFLTTPTGALLYDYRKMNQRRVYTIPSSDVNSARLIPNRCLSIEIKPKAGYIAFSPLVHPLHRVKFRKSRFVLLQELYKYGTIEKGWAKKMTSDSVEKISNYDPLDLYSMDTSRMHNAFSQLFECPQNNLKVFYNASAVVGHGIDKIESENALREMYSNMFQISGATKTPSDDNIRQVIETRLGVWLTKILAQENILQHLLQLQKLDVLDADGAVLVYQRLVELCEGSHKEAQGILDDFNLPNLPPCNFNTPSGFELLKSSPFFSILEPDIDISVLKTICDEIVRFNAQESNERIDEIYRSLVSKVQLLSITECKFLLLNWLLSLSMCDVSLFITIEKLEGTGISKVSGNVSPVDVVPMSSNDNPGLLICQLSGKSMHYLYSLRLIDCDRKPSIKLQSRKQKESVFQTIS